MHETKLCVHCIGDSKTVEEHGQSLRCTIPMFRKRPPLSVEKVVGWVVAAPGLADCISGGGKVISKRCVFSEQADFVAPHFGRKFLDAKER